MKILCVIDMQNDFIDGSLGTAEAQAIVPKVVEKIKNFNGDFIYATRDTHFDETVTENDMDDIDLETENTIWDWTKYDESLEGIKLPIKHCIYKSHGWHLNEEIQATLLSIMSNGAAVYTSIYNKPTFGSFELKEEIYSMLPAYVQKSDVIEICGLCTDICVISNALILRSSFPNTKIVVDASCCAGTTPEKHKAALEVMKSCQIDVIND